MCRLLPAGPVPGMTPVRTPPTPTFSTASETLWLIGTIKPRRELPVVNTATISCSSNSPPQNPIYELSWAHLVRISSLKLAVRKNLVSPPLAHRSPSYCRQRLRTGRPRPCERELLTNSDTRLELLIRIRVVVPRS